MNGFQSNELYETLVTNNGGGATQTSGGIKGTGTNAKYTYGGNGYFGVGGQGGIISYDQGPGGGGGYYGGGGISFASSGGGGSSFISGYPGCNAIREYPNTGAIVHTGQPNHYSGYTFSNAVMKAGNETMPNYGNIATMTGNRGHGYGKVTPLIIENGIVASNLVTNSGFEGELNNWKPTVGAVFTTPKSNSFESEKSIQLDMLATAGTYQNLDQKFIIGTDVFIGHKYYAREWYQILNEDDSGLKFYSEIVYQNSSNGYITTAGNFFKATTSRTSNWEMGSFLFTLNDGVDYNQIALRPLITNNIKGVGSARADAVVLLDLTAIYGAGKEPDKAWCDTHIPYFEGTWILPKNS